MVKMVEFPEKEVLIKKIIKDIDDPIFATDHSVGLDLRAAEDVIIKPKEMKVVRTGVVMRPPKGYFILVAPRSSLFKRKGLIQVNSVGIIDPDYSGENDEILIQLYNLSDQEAKIEKNERIAQAVFLKYITPKIKFVENMDKEDRGGIGSTGEF